MTSPRSKAFSAKRTASPSPDVASPVMQGLFVFTASLAWLLFFIAKAAT